MSEMGDGWVSIPVSEFEHLHAEIRRLSQAHAAALKMVGVQTPLLDVLRTDNERLCTEVDRLSRALSHA